MFAPRVEPLARRREAEPVTGVGPGGVHHSAAGFRTVTVQLWDAWWDKTPPANTGAERRRHARSASSGTARHLTCSSWHGGLTPPSGRLRQILFTCGAWRGSGGRR
jgi:hypothetical protein